MIVFRLKCDYKYSVGFMVPNNEGVRMFGMTIRLGLYIFTDYISTLGMELQISDSN